MKQPWGNNSDPKESYWTALVRSIFLKDDFYRLLKQAAPDDAQVLIDIKSQKSFFKKLMRKSADEIHDVLRGAIVVKKQDEMYQVRENLKRLAPSVEDDEKILPDDTTGYHGSIHLKILLHGMICEIQIMPENIWVSKEILHHHYEKSKTGALDPSIQRFSKVVYDTAKKSSL